VAESVGGDDFGIPRMPPGHDLSDTPVKYVKYIWPKVFPDLEESTKDTEDIPILIGIAIQQVMKDSHEVIDPGMSARIAMECAVPMSKIDPYTVI